MSEIDEKLEGLKEELKAAETDIDKKSRERDALKADVAYLEKKISEVHQVVNSYSTVFESIDKDKTDLDDYVVTKLNRVNVALSVDEKEEVDKKIAEVEFEIKTLKENIETLNNNYEIAKSSFEAVQKELNERQGDFDRKKTYQSEIANKMKTLKNLRDLIEKADGKKEFPKMYFLVTELQKKLQKDDDSTDFKLKPMDEFENDFEDAWMKLNKAKEDFRNKEEIMRTTQKDLEKEQRAYDEKKAKREIDILERIKTLEVQ